MAEKFIFNRGPRKFVLRPGPDGKKRVLMPGATIQALDEKEAAQLLRYKRDCVDASLQTPKNDAKIAELVAALAKEREERAKLEASLQKVAKDEPAPRKPSDDVEDSADISPEPKASEDESPERKRKGSRKGR